MPHTQNSSDPKTERRSHHLSEVTYPQLLASPPHLAVLPWGATEAHGHHLPYGTDDYEGSRLAYESARRASIKGAQLVVLPTIPFGNDEQQLDQLATISIRTQTAAALLGDIVRSLHRQGLKRLLILNAHGGNEFKPLVRDLEGEFGEFLIVVANFYQIAPEKMAEIFDHPGDHAGDLETSLMLHLYPDLVRMEEAGDGRHLPFTMEQLAQSGVWTPRPWSKCHPDTGSGNPQDATAEKGKRYFDVVCEHLACLMLELADPDARLI